MAFGRPASTSDSSNEKLPSRDSKWPFICKAKEGDKLAHFRNPNHNVGNFSFFSEASRPQFLLIANSAQQEKGSADANRLTQKIL